MKARFQREALLAACQLASAAVPSKDIKPVLRNFKLVATSERCDLMATDLEVGICLSVDGFVVDEPGDAVVPAALLIEILREVREPELTMDCTADNVHVAGPDSEFDLPSEDPGAFPEWPLFEDDGYHEIAAGSLREMIRRTLFATNTSAGRFVMNGVAWVASADSIDLVATDGKRLAVCRGAATCQGESGSGKPIVPNKAMAMLEKSLKVDDSELVKVIFRQNDVMFRVGSLSLYSMLVDGRFPDYEKILPTKHSSTATIKAGRFCAAVRQAAVSADSEARKVSFTFEGERLKLKAEGSTRGRSCVEMPVEFDGRNPIVFMFNPANIVEMLRVLDPDTELSFEMTKGEQPAMFRCEGYRYLVMPMS